VLPEGGQLKDGALDSHVRKLQAAVAYAREAGEMVRDESARALWRQVYPDLSEGKPGLLGAMVARAEAQVMRMACIYALLDCSPIVKEIHLRAALAVWRYCEDSARFIFGDSLGDPVADELLRALRSEPEGLTRTQITNHFGRNRGAREIARALGVLLEYGLVRREQSSSGAGRPAEVWTAKIAYETNERNEVSPDIQGVSSYDSFLSCPDTETGADSDEDDWGEV